MSLVANNILLMRNSNHSLMLEMANPFPDLSESDLNVKKNRQKKLVIE